MIFFPFSLCYIVVNVEIEYRINFVIFCSSRLCMDNLPDTPQTESTIVESSPKPEGDDDPVDPRVQVCCSEFDFIHTSI